MPSGRDIVSIYGLRHALGQSREVVQSCCCHHTCTDLYHHRCPLSHPSVLTRTDGGATEDAAILPLPLAGKHLGSHQCLFRGYVTWLLNSTELWVPETPSSDIANVSSA